MSERWSLVEDQRSCAYHEAAHAVVDILEGHTVRYVSIETEGTGYRDICVAAVAYQESPSGDVIPVPREALGHAIATIAGSMAEWKKLGKTYPWDSWEKIIDECEEIEELDDPDEFECDTIAIRKYCEAAALFGQTVRMPAPDEQPEGTPPLSPPPKTGKEAFEVALRDAEYWLNLYWPAITKVVEKLLEVGYLTGEEVEEIVDSWRLYQGETS